MWCVAFASVRWPVAAASQDAQMQTDSESEYSESEGERFAAKSQDEGVDAPLVPQARAFMEEMNYQAWDEVDRHRHRLRLRHRHRHRHRH